MSTDRTFITNEDGQSLHERFRVLLRNNTRHFDCLVGYFFISGFYKLYPALAKTEKIRILVGIKTDRATYNLIQEGKQQEFILESHAQAKDAATSAVRNELEKSEDTADVEEGVRKFVEWIASGKLEIKAYPSERVHAKLYIMTFVDGHIDKGRVITGSSNFTEAGLVENLEFNVELKNPSDYDFALAKFNELWKVAVEVSKDFVQTIETQSPYAQFTPYELYLKFLYEYFQGTLNLPDELDDAYLPTDFKKLKYQEDAVLNAVKVLNDYDGVFLSDVVGLGKTFMSALLARQLDGRSLVIAPPHLLDRHNPGSWWNVYRNFEAVIEKARTACLNSGQRVEDHFVEITEMIGIGKGGQRAVKTVLVSRYAGYLAARVGAFLPKVMIIDSPMKNISERENPDQFAGFHEMLHELAETELKGTEFIIIDKEVFRPKEGTLLKFQERHMKPDDAENPPLIRNYRGK
jgi:hypothetical protein